MKNHDALKKAFLTALSEFVKELRDHVAGEDGQWAVKGFIDIYRNVFTVSSDTKIVSKILEIHLFHKLLKTGYLEAKRCPNCRQGTFHGEMTAIS